MTMQIPLLLFAKLFIDLAQ
uniref:Uncharacterized protein n=1 Tax=Arundo donax TaxID=35708 RepID=A0A0A9EP13_ARUDO